MKDYKDMGRPDLTDYDEWTVEELDDYLDIQDEFEEFKEQEQK